jgi:hypothetical protein
VHLAQGGNLRTAPRLPFVLTRRAAHEALFASENLAPLQALLFGHLRACGGHGPNVLEVLAHVGQKPAATDSVWLELYEKVARAPGIPPHQVRPLCDYVFYRRFRCERRDRFVLRGCSIPSLLKRMEEWHVALRAEAFRRAMAVRRFRFGYEECWPSRFEDRAFEGNGEHGEYSVRELRSAKELFEEGQHMHHCVATYTEAASRGEVSIWSLRLTRDTREVGRVTIRVALPSREVVEARRFANQKIQPHELELVQAWAKRRGVTMPQSL